MLKKLIMICLTASLILFAEGSSTYAAESNNVKDSMNYLTVEQIQTLQETEDKIKTAYGLESVIVITDDVEGKSTIAFADDYYDENSYGIGEDKSGLLLLINMADRDAWISTSGKAIDIFTDARIDSMLDGVVSGLKEEDYNAACTSFLSDVDGYALQGIPDGQYRIEQEAPYRGTYGERAVALMFNPLVIGGALIISIAAATIITLSGKGRVTVTPQTYEEKGSFVLIREVDSFLRELVTRQKIESDSGGGGSSTHTGSSGSSHGGGGRGF